MTTKDSVLAELLNSSGYVSGEGISRALGVTRAAVSSSVKALRTEGCVIESVTNRGYRLISVPDRITPGSLQAYLGEERMQRVLCYESTDSTNRRLQEAVLEGRAPHGLIAVANEQTAGRGRLGRTFASPRDKGIYLSMLLRPEALARPDDTALQSSDSRQTPAGGTSWTALTSWTAVAVCRAIEKICGLKPGIKWVNDLLLDGKKVCGILTQMELESETGTVRDIIVGIGVNVQEREEDFPEELREIAGSLYQASGQETDRSALAAEMIRQLDRLCEDWTRPDAAAEYLQEYRGRSLVIGKPVQVITAGKAKEAAAESIGGDFSLHVRYMDGTEEDLRGGEISIRPGQL